MRVPNGLRNERLPLPDAPTIHLCTLLASAAFGAMFVALWLIRGRGAYYLLCGAGALIYAATLTGLLIPDRGLLLSTLLFIGLGAYNSFLLAAVRAFEGKRVMDGWIVALPILSGAAFGMFAFSPETVSMGQTANSVFLGFSTLAVGLVLVRTRGSRAPRSRRLLAIFQLAYVPAYVISVMLALSIDVGIDWLALVPLLSDQLLLGVLNIALLAMPGEQAEAALSEAALKDPLTGAWNRAGLATIEKALREPAGVIVFDVDHFKEINDRHGHAAGDAILIALVAGAKATLPPGSHLVRLGGDEFAAVLPGLPDIETGREMAERLRKLAMPQPGCTISLGMARSERSEIGLANALSRADDRLYQAKSAGRNRVAA